jgi:hypothetical protein
MAKDNADSMPLQSILTEEFFYFFLRLRKDYVRKGL